MHHGWQNVHLIQADLKTRVLPADSVDAIVSFYTNDIMTSPQAVEHTVQMLRPGGCVDAPSAPRHRQHNQDLGEL